MRSRVLVTGMSGPGKSTVLAALAERGHRVVDTDTDEWCRWVTLPDGSADWIWREDAMAALLDRHTEGELEPLLRATEIDASAPPADVVRALEAL